MLILKIYALIIFVVGIYVLILSTSNKRYLKKCIKTPLTITDGPLVSVLIPARNEEKRLPSLLDSLVKQTYKNIEILVIDDNSTDRTYEIIQDYEKRYPSLIKGYKGKEKIEGAIGKTFALSQIQHLAKGEYLMATDADTRHEPSSVAYALTMLQSGDYDLVSGFPEEKCPSFAGSCCISAMNFAPVIYIPFSFASKHPRPSLTLANGQMMMIKASALKEVGGYEAIFGKVCDDVQLAKLFVRKGKKYAFVNVSHTIQTDMYEDFKTAFYGIMRSIGGIFPPKIWALIPILLIIVVLVALAIAPLSSVLMAVLVPNLSSYTILLTIGWLLFLYCWYSLARLQRFPISVSLCYSFTLILICEMYFESFYLGFTGKKVHWKGRLV